jgi:PST family polysaccharide transporter
VSFSSLKAQVVSGTFLVAGAQLLRQLIQLGAIVLLARMVAPSDFGLMALAVGCLAFAQVLSDFGLSAALEREKVLDPAVESRLFRLNLWSALLVAVIAMTSAPMLARLFNQPDLTFLLRVLAVPFLVAGAVRTRTSTLARKMQFGRLGAVEVIPVVLGTSVSVTLAYMNWGIVALVAGSAVQQVAWTATALLVAGVPSASPAPLRRVAPHVRFGGMTALFQVVNTTARKLDDLLVGGLMGVAALGLYEKSYALMMIPAAYLAGAATRVLYPSLSKVRDDPAQFRMLYLGAVRKIAGLSFPAAAVCSAAAGPIVLLVLGPRFKAAVPIFAVLALTLGLQPLLSIGGPVFMALDRMRRYLAISIAASCVLILGFIMGALQGSPLAMAQWFVAAYLLIFAPLVAIALRTAGVRWSEFLVRAGPPAVSAIAAWCVGTATARLGVGWQLPAMAVTYLAAHMLIDRSALIDLFRFLNPRRIVVPAAAIDAQEQPAHEDVAAEAGRGR